MTRLVQTTRWYRSEFDRHVHAWRGEQWAGDEIALCQHACPPAHVICDQHGPVCPRCRELSVDIVRTWSRRAEAV